MTERLEEETLSEYAQRSARSRGRRRPEPPCPVRTCFQRDRDRIIHSKAFRRLMHKTQVFISPEGDHYRTRLTHTLEVAQIARNLARGLRLNEDLTEAIALGHDLGHTPYGHGGEAALNRLLPGGFRHNEQSLRVVDLLEGGAGLNLTWEVRDGILNHCGELKPATLEGMLVKLADRIAYVNHDIDDALRAGLLRPSDLPPECTTVLGQTHSARIATMVEDVIREGRGRPQVRMSAAVEDAMEGLRAFLFGRVYVNSPAKRAEGRAQALLEALVRHYAAHPDLLPQWALTAGGWEPARSVDEPLRPIVDERDRRLRAAADYVAAMTDRYALNQYRELFEPEPWGREGRGG
ncbi:MAG: deoxyguanosinetriphosphate triphosphohydrolase [Acetobacteraceae bacterium]|nr:deoxyguanosinetriphosphate triphosphohydrolase [Acetobacteraceae bacterium]